jgi:TPR repeat protein
MRCISLPIMLFIFFSFQGFCDELNISHDDIINKYEALKTQADKGTAEDKYALYDYVDNNAQVLGEFLTTSFKVMVEGALSGHTASLLRIGGMYMDGYRVEKNLPVALTWLLEAARSGDVEAELLCGINYATQYMDANSTNDLDEFYKQSDHWLTKAMNQGNLTAKTLKAHLALIHYDVPPFPALDMLRESAEEGDRRAMYFLGDWYKIQWEKQRNKHDYEQAVFWLDKASNLGDVDAKNDLSELIVSMGE